MSERRSPIFWRALLLFVRGVLALFTLGSVWVVWRAAEADAYRAASMEYGASVFALGHPDTTDRDFDMLKAAGMTWAKIPVLWSNVEGSCNDCFYWDDLDRVVRSAQARGIHLIARLDHQ